MFSHFPLCHFLLCTAQNTGRDMSRNYGNYGDWEGDGNDDGDNDDSDDDGVGEDDGVGGCKGGSW